MQVRHPKLLQKTNIAVSYKHGQLALLRQTTDSVQRSKH